MVLTHKLDLLLIALPMLRPLRLLRLVVLGATAARATVGVRRDLARPGFQSFLLVAVTIVAVGAGLVYLLERDAAASTFEGPADALWWALVTATTVGYGDHYPVTAAGRGVAVLLMLLGIGVFSVVTANVAAYSVEAEGTKARETELLARPERIEGMLHAEQAARQRIRDRRRRQRS